MGTDWKTALENYKASLAPDVNRAIASHFFFIGHPAESVRPVAIGLLPEADAAICQDFAPQKCYVNAFTYILRAPSGPVDYVVGFALLRDCPVPIEHAWVRIGDRFFDPTVQFVDREIPMEKFEYYPAEILDKDTALRVMHAMRDGYPPTLEEIIAWRQSQESLGA